MLRFRDVRDALRDGPVAIRMEPNGTYRVGYRFGINPFAFYTPDLEEAWNASQHLLGMVPEGEGKGAK